ncbi:pectinesterase family protein [Sphingomonas crusticola]|uniref:pectinesterase family protein n=1 Tax=Sphingomonas crusticola TaxID=1697973 RepID=UPI000E22FA87|nr:pectinesterase family protein [Sphingomonas crusticola]
MTSEIDRRAVLAGTVALAAAASAPAWAAPGPFDAVLSRDGKQRGQIPGYRTIADAMAAAPQRDAGLFRILVPRGEWRERIVVTKPNICLIGEDRSASRLVSNSLRKDRRPGEAATATVLVRAPGFQAARMTIANDFDYNANMPAEVDFDRTGASGAQAQAIMLDIGSDRAIFHRVDITGFQDTLWAEVGRVLFRACLISGNVDFIYGGARALFDRCTIVSRLRPNKDFNGFIAAPNTNVHQPFGLVFIGCRLTKEPGVAPHTVALGRAWKRQRTFPDGQYADPDAVGQAVYIRCWMDDHIVPEGWYRMHYYPKGGGMAFIEPEAARFFEYRSFGPGAGPASPRRRMLTPQQAAKFTEKAIFDGWHARPAST